MILLDTYFLVELVTAGSMGGARALAWLESGQQLATSAIAWSEFCNGPLSSEQKEAVYSVIDQRALEFTWREAEEAARLFNLSGRRRGSHADCMIAASAILSGASIATINQRDFERFVPYGLTLEPNQ